MKPKIFFKSAEHKLRWYEIIRQLYCIHEGRLDPHYGSALYILTSDPGMWHVAQEYVSREGLRIEAFLQEIHHSTGESVLTRLAGNLFDPQSLHVDPVEFTVLDKDNFSVAISAIAIRCYGLRVEDISA